jgi:hypothetical protein
VFDPPRPRQSGDGRSPLPRPGHPPCGVPPPRMPGIGNRPLPPLLAGPGDRRVLHPGRPISDEFYRFRPYYHGDPEPGPERRPTWPARCSSATALRPGQLASCRSGRVGLNGTPLRTASLWGGRRRPPKSPPSSSTTLEPSRTNHRPRIRPDSGPNLSGPIPEAMDGIRPGPSCPRSTKSSQRRKSRRPAWRGGSGCR